MTVDRATGEILDTPTMTATEARNRIDRVRAGVETIREDVLALWSGRAWVALGVESWDVLCDTEFGVRLALPRPERVAIVTDLREQGMSTRAIGSALGISQATATRDSRESNDSRAPVVGLDGKQYAPTATPARPADQWPAKEQELLEQLRAGETVVVNMGGAGHPRLWSYAESFGKGVRIDRRSDWGNPFVLPDDGDRDEVCEAYAHAYWPLKPSLHARVDELRGKALGCWCAPLRCHGDFLRELVS